MLRKDWIFALSLISLSLWFVIVNWKTEMAIIFFPIDYDRNMVQSRTTLVALDDKVTIDWTSFSQSEEKSYLRQDVSLLFVNGKLKGVQNKWMEHTDVIEQKQLLDVTTDALLEAISFHHGEIHEGNAIYSIQSMSNDYLYVIDRQAFHTPKTAKEKTESEKLKTIIDKNLQKKWDQLIDFYQMDEKNYKLYPLTDMMQFYDDLAAETSEMTSDRVIGQLWEGLYKHYILPAIELEAADDEPIILLHNDLSHLYVLYELNGKKQQLIQQIVH